MGDWVKHVIKNWWNSEKWLPTSKQFVYKELSYMPHTIYIWLVYCIGLFKCDVLASVVKCQHCQHVLFYQEKAIWNNCVLYHKKKHNTEILFDSFEHVIIEEQWIKQCWNSNSTTTSNTLDFLLTPSAQQARRLFVWISFINNSRCNLNIQDRCWS